MGLDKIQKNAVLILTPTAIVGILSYMSNGENNMMTLGQAAKFTGVHHSTLLALLRRCLLESAQHVQRGRKNGVVFTNADAFRAEVRSWVPKETK